MLLLVSPFRTTRQAHRIPAGELMSTVAPPYTREETRDLGFGSVVSQEQQIRLLNRDGSFNVERRGYSFWEALSSYHELVTMSWPKFYAIVFLVFVVANVLFGGLYLL